MKKYKQKLKDEVLQEITVEEKSVRYDIYHGKEFVAGIVSERPYHLGMNNDGTTMNCLVAIVANLIKRTGIYFPSNLSEDFMKARRIGAAEGVQYPKKWGPGEKELLKNGLLEYGLERYAKHIV